MLKNKFFNICKNSQKSIKVDERVHKISKYTFIWSVNKYFLSSLSICSFFILQYKYLNVHWSCASKIFHFVELGGFLSQKSNGFAFFSFLFCFGLTPQQNNLAVEILFSISKISETKEKGAKYLKEELWCKK